jgi:uncharacterized glyoxalase superfamily protein PhnB
MAARPRLESVTPILSVVDVSAALDWYQRVLGFAVEWRRGDPIELAGICRDDVAVNLAQRAKVGPAGPSQVYLEVTGIDALYAELTRSGVAIRVPIGDRPYGMRDFSIADASGNVLDLGEPIERLDR